MLIPSSPPLAPLAFTGSWLREDQAWVRNIPGQHRQRDGCGIEGVEVGFVGADRRAVGGRELDRTVGDSDLYLKGLKGSVGLFSSSSVRCGTSRRVTYGDENE